MKIDPSLLTITLDRDSTTSLTRQVYQQIRRLVLTGRLTHGTRLPSTRAFGDDHGVSRTVVLNAYDQLVAEGYLNARRGSGMYVAPVTVDRAGPALAKARVVQRDDNRIDLRTSHPFDLWVSAADRFPHSVWAKMLARGWRRHGASMTLKPDPKGLFALREAIVEHVHGLRGVYCDPEQILITEGHSDALALVAALMKERVPTGRIHAWVENPGHMGACAALRREGVRLSAIPVDAEGLQVSVGKRRSPRAKLALVTPARQFPLGMEMSLNRRLALLAWAGQAGALVVEDDYDCDLRFAGNPLASLWSLDETGRVAMMGSFSKAFFPGLRLGYLVASRDVADALAAIRTRRGITLASSGQAALAEFIGSGALTRHLRAVRRDVRTRRHALMTQLRSTFGDDLIVQPHEVGTHVTVILGSSIDDRTTDVRIAEAAARNQLHLSPLSKQYADGTRAKQGFLLGYAGWSVQEIHKGVERMERSIGRYLQK